jgi:hypothetical protein
VRSASASALLIACVVVATACATSPRRLPPRRTAFAQGAPPATTIVRPPDLVQPTEPPIRHERYLGWTLLVDAVSIVPLVQWMGRPDDVYLAAPALLAAPLVHLAHGQSEKAAISLLMRGAMIGGVYLAGREARTECSHSDAFLCVPIGSVLLADLAIVPVVVIDSLLLARRTVPEEGWHRLPIMPTAGVTRDGGRVFSLVGQF